ncbi:MAG: MBL fold metallo-hydrolase [Atopobiaceae bacterium]|nr:MBL fold metallo-hydrolase [Atopobiaceae bacterium]
MKLTMLGTGNALVTECYNTCFVLDDDGQHLMVDGGGGSTILSQLKHAGYDWMDMRHIFVTHRHVDHLLGIVWMVRMICQFMDHGDYQGEAWIYSHAEVLDLLRDLAIKLLRPQETHFIDGRLHMVEVTDGQELNIIGHRTTFFDIGSTKATQFGFCMELDEGRRVVCCGDEPLSDAGRPYARGAEWMLHEAFCLYSQADVFDPYVKHHSTVKDACELAEELGVRNLVLYHTEDHNLTRRKELYAAEGQSYFSGNLWIPEDLESIEIN